MVLKALVDCAKACENQPSDERRRRSSFVKIAGFLPLLRAQLSVSAGRVLTHDWDAFEPWKSKVRFCDPCDLNIFHQNFERTIIIIYIWKFLLLSLVFGGCICWKCWRCLFSWVHFTPSHNFAFLLEIWMSLNERSVLADSTWFLVLSSAPGIPILFSCLQL